VGWLKKRVAKAGEEKRRPITSEERLAFVTLATSLLGRDQTDGSTFDGRVQATIAGASKGNEGAALELLAIAIRDHDVTITIDELSAIARSARAFGLHEDQWTFVGASVDRSSSGSPSPGALGF
jgi:hypothetical protein